MGGLAYTMVGALVGRASFTGGENKKHYGGGEWCPGFDLCPGVYGCPACRNRRLDIYASVFWPVAITVWTGFAAVRALVYIPFRAAASAIAKPDEAA